MMPSHPTSDSTALSGSPALQAAHQRLKQFNCLTPLSEVDRSVTLSALAADDRAALQSALQLVAQHSDYQMLGICADTLAEGLQALRHYSQALGYDSPTELPPLEGAVYIKFNPKAGTCYASAYPGTHRGVLVSCQSADESDINDLYGHLPLDLYP